MKINIIKIHDFLTKKYNQSSFEYCIFTTPTAETIKIHTKDFDLWQKLSYKYSRKELMIYFIEMIRVRFPELKGRIIEFANYITVIFDPKIRHMFYDSYKI